MRVALAWLWEMFKPPSGVQARRVVMAFTLLVMAGRFGLTRLTSLGSASRINVVPAWQYGVAFLLLFVALYCTLDTRRLTIAGFRRVAGVSKRSLLCAHGAHSAGRGGDYLEGAAPC